MKKRNLKLIAGLMCFKFTAYFSLLIGHFLGQPNEALLVFKDLQPNRPDKATYLANQKEIGLAIFRKKKKLLGWSVVNIKEKAV